MNTRFGSQESWARKSTAQGRRRVSIRQREKLIASQAVAPSDSAALGERGTKRTCSPVGSTAKRMRLGESEEEEGTSYMKTEDKYHQRLEDENGPIEPELQVTSSYSSSSGRSTGPSSGRSSRTAVEDDMDDEVPNDVYLEEEEDDDVEDEAQNEEYLEEEGVDEEDEEDYMRMDNTHIITSDEGEGEEYNRLIDGPMDTESRLVCFRKLSVNLKQRTDMFPLKEPTPLTNRCRGMGKACEVWTVLCHKDEIHSICNEHFMVPHKMSRPRRGPNEPYSPEPRAILIDWMQDVCWTEKLQRETFHLAIDYVDRVLAKGPEMEVYVQMDMFQLLGTTALFIAAKYEEIYPPKVEDMVSYTAGACTVRQVRSLEMVIIKVLEWELNVITPLHWTHLFLELLTGDSKQSPSSSCLSLLAQPADDFFLEEDSTELPVTSSSCARDDFMHFAYLMDVVMLHSASRKYSNRMLAAALLYTVYDADDAIEKATGLSVHDDTVRDAVQWLQPIVNFCEEFKVPLFKLPVMEGIRPDAIHRIQIHRETMMHHSKKDLEVVMGAIDDARIQMAKQRTEELRQRLYRDFHSLSVE